jgi:hypothetical protein
MVAHPYRPSTLKADAEGLLVLSQPRLHNENLSQKKKKERKKEKRKKIRDYFPSPPEFLRQET